MFERYTEKARRVIFFARYEASQYGAHAIEAEHVLLGLLREDKLLVEALFKTPYTTPEVIRKEIEAASPTHEKVSASVDLPLSTGCKKVLSYAADESKRLEHRHIGTAHLLLGIIREGRSLAARVLAGHGITAEQIVTALQENEYLLHSAAPSAEPIHGGGSGGRVAPLVDPIQLQFAGQLRALLQLLVERGVISEEEKQRIIDAKV